MNRDEVSAAVLRALGEIAPEADQTSIEPDLALRDQLDLDSMDMLNFAIALHTAFGIEIPESDYPKFATLTSAVDYVLAAAARGAGRMVARKESTHVDKEGQGDEASKAGDHA